MAEEVLLLGCAAWDEAAGACVAWDAVPPSSFQVSTTCPFFTKEVNCTQFWVNLSEVLYFESVDNHTFLYTQEDVMEIKQRLYELEEILSDKDFVRISKSLIVNINKIRSLKPELNRTILVTLCNGELLYISRKYVPFVRKLLSI